MRKFYYVVLLFLLCLTGCGQATTEKAEVCITAEPIQKSVQSSAIPKVEKEISKEEEKTTKKRKHNIPKMKKEDSIYYIDNSFKQKKGNYVKKKNIIIDGRQYTSVKYIKDGKNSIRLISLKTKEDTLVIPSHIDGYAVTKLGGEYEEIPGINSYGVENEGRYAWLYKNKKKLKKVVISGGIKKIRSSAFVGICAKEIVLPKSLKKVGGSAFSTSKIKKVVVKNSKINLGDNAFANSTLKEIELPKNFSGKIGMDCFRASQLCVFHWPDYKKYKYRKVGGSAFENCKKLKEIIFPENQKHIYVGEDVFLGCKNLQKLSFPATTKEVTYESNFYADNFDYSVEVLEFKGKNTKLNGLEYKRKLDYHIVTVRKIIAPKNSAAIEVVKNAKKISSVNKKVKKNIKLHRDPLCDLERSPSITLVPMEYEEVD